MKKLLSLLLTGALMLGALPSALAGDAADGLPALREQAAQGWHETYEAHGREIVVDIPVQVPEAQTMPILAAAWMPLAASLPDTSKEAMGISDGAHQYYNELGMLRVDTPDQKTSQSAPGQPEPPRGMAMQPSIIRLNQLDWDTPYTFGLPLTVRDADKLITDTASAYFANEKLTFAPHWVHARAGMRRYDEREGTFSGEVWEGSNAPLIVYFDQVIGGFPVLGYSNEDDIREDRTADRSTYLGAIAILQDQGLDAPYTSAQLLTLKVDSVQQETVTLLDFSKIKAACEQLITDGCLRTVTSLRLGYAARYAKDGQITLLPAWALEGELFDSAEAEYQVRVTEATDWPLEYTTLLIDAQTGAMMNDLR